MPKNLVAASSVPLVLALLARGESYGYALIQQVRTLSDGDVEWTEGMLYPVLHRLEKDRLVEARWGRSPNGRRRRYYRITASGRASLDVARRQWSRVDATLRLAWEPSCPTT